MADNNQLTSRVLDFISNHRNGHSGLHDIAHSLNVEKKLVNRHLHILERAGSIARSPENPKMWSLNGARCGGASYYQYQEDMSQFTQTSQPQSFLNENNNMYSGTIRRSRYRGGRGRNRSFDDKRSDRPSTPRTSPKIDRELMDKILHCLRSSQAPRKTIDIARSCGHKTSGEINPTLYQLRRQGLTQKIQDQPPLWVAVQAPMPISLRLPLFSAPEPNRELLFPFSAPASIPYSYRGGYTNAHNCHAPRSRGRGSVLDRFWAGDQGKAPGGNFASSVERDPPTAPHREVAGGEDKMGDKVNQEVGNGETSEQMKWDVEEEGDSPDEETDFSLTDRISDLMSYNGDYFKLPTISSGLDEDSEEEYLQDPHEQAKSDLRDFDEEHWDGAGHSLEMPEDFKEILLKTLSQKPSATAAAFVLAHDLDCSIANVNEVLSNCEKEGLVSHRGNMWVLNKTGREHMVSVGLNVAAERVAPMQPPNSMSPRRLLGAPPIPPLQLLNTTTGALYTVRSAPKTNVAAAVTATSTATSSQASSVVNSPVKNLSVEPDSPSKVDTGRSTPVEGLPLPQTFGSFGSLHSLETNLAAMTAPFRPPPPSVDVVSQRLANTGISPPSTPTKNVGSIWSEASSPEKLGTGSVCGDDIMKSVPSLDINTESFAALNKNPVSALMEYAQSRHVEAKIEVISQKGPSHRPVFTLAAYIGNRMFTPITCSNKKDGRKDAADVAIRTLIAEGQYNTDRLMAQVKPSVPLESMTHFDRMAALSHKTFNTLIAAIPETFTGRKVIAAIILRRSEDDMGMVISVGSGNRCITGQQLSLEGNTVNDSHAEVISRRGFMRFIYRQLENYEEGKPHEMFELGNTGRLRLREGVSFHMYISTAPCGDGALFSPRDSGTNKSSPNESCDLEHNPTFTSNAQGLLRTKMEGGEGTIPIEPGFKAQTFDGIQRGERLRTMSCADKICRWNIVGLQGSLLNNLLEPIYMESLTLGYLYDHGHLARAVCCRLAKGDPPIDEVLPSGFRLHHPWLGRVTACDPPRETQKTKALSLNWTIGDDRAEVLDGTLGLCYTGVEKTMFSRLTKKCMYESYKTVCTKWGRYSLLNVHCYRDAKSMCTDFKKADAVCKQRFKDNGFGIWISKPVEEEMFQ